jgi:hypothetical protein
MKKILILILPAVLLLSCRKEAEDSNKRIITSVSKDYKGVANKLTELNNAEKKLITTLKTK